MRNNVEEEIVQVCWAYKMKDHYTLLRIYIASCSSRKFLRVCWFVSSCVGFIVVSRSGIYFEVYKHSIFTDQRTMIINKSKIKTGRELNKEVTRGGKM